MDWYDWLSCGNNTRESWWTVNAKTGKLLTLDDMVRQEKKDSLSTLMMAQLVNGRVELYAEQYAEASRNKLEILSRADGSALTSEGLVIKLKDNCRLFDPAELGNIFDPIDPAGNIGIRLVRKVCREMEYHSLLGLNVLSITM